MNLLGIVLSYSYIGALLLIASHLTKYGEEMSRKFVHILSVNWWFIVMFFFDRMIEPLLIGISFIIVNLITYHFSIFKSIERTDDHDSKGTIYYGISLTILVILSFYYHDLYIGLMGSLIMGYGDGLAAIIGKKTSFIPYHVGKNTKSVAGTATMFVISFIIAMGILYYSGYQWSGMGALIIASIVTALENIGIKGVDNILVPLAGAIIYMVLVGHLEILI
ncbi:MAG: diacylglycerol/polyprenol kinase family protein [Cellulosilyticaceae bacterium]